MESDNSLPFGRSRIETSHEDGFALIAAIWLLVLAGAIVALLMLRGMQAGESAKGEAQLLQNKLAIEAALDTVVAEWVIEGGRSHWQQGSTSSVEIDGNSVQVALSRENARIDLNATSLDFIDAALARAGVERNRRIEIIGGLQVARGEKRKIVDPAEVRAILDGSQKRSGGCLSDMFTTASGLAQPAGGTATSGAAVSQTTQPAPLAMGEPVRMGLTTSGGHNATAVVRITGQRDVFQLISWGEGGMCGSF